MVNTICNCNKSLNIITYLSTNSEESGCQFFVTKASIHTEVTFSNIQMASCRAFHIHYFPVKTIAK